MSRLNDKPRKRLGQSPSQTVGPFFHYGLIFGYEHNLVRDGTAGERIIVTGTVFDGNQERVPDAMLEIWQADANGIFIHPGDPQHAHADPHFTGFGRAGTKADGRYTFRTIKPGCLTGASAPHLNVRIFARGLLIHLVTRLYFSDEDNANDAVFRSVAPTRRETLVAKLESTRDLPTYRFDVQLQGERETVFFDL